MALLCYNKGCGEKFDADKNKDGETLPTSVPLLLNSAQDGPDPFIGF